MALSHELAAAAMDSFWSHKEAGDFDNGISLLGSLGMRPNVVEFVLDPDSYYFPNQRGNQLVRPKSVSEEKIPIMALEPGQTYGFESPMLHALQRNALLLAGCSMPQTDALDAVFRKQSGVMNPSNGSVGAAYVWRSLVKAGASPSMQIESAPRLAFNVAAHTQPGEIPFQGVALHELVHVAQTLSNPVWKDGDLRTELEAYAVQATLIHNNRVPYTNSTAMAGQIDAYRQKWLGTNEFETNPDFERAFSHEPAFAKMHSRLGRAS